MNVSPQLDNPAVVSDTMSMTHTESRSTDQLRTGDVVSDYDAAMSYGLPRNRAEREVMVPGPSVNAQRTLWGCPSPMATEECSAHSSTAATE